MQAKEIFDHLGHKEFMSYFQADFDGDSTPTLDKKMYSGQAPDEWPKAASDVGVFMAKFGQVAAKSNVKNATAANFTSASSLHDWLRSLGSSKDAYLNILPERIRAPYTDSTEHMQQRAAEAVKLLEQQDYVCLQNAVTRNIKLKDSQIRFNGNNIHATYGPSTLDASIFVADVLLMYFKQTGVLEHGVQYKTVEMAQKFGQALDEERGRLGATEDDRKQFWSNVSLLTGWEVVRRYVTKDNVDEILARAEHDPASVVECGLRLINNENIKNPNFLVAVALALLY